MQGTELPRIATWVKLRRKNAGAETKPVTDADELWVFNCHWAHEEEVQMKSSNMLMLQVVKIMGARAGAPLVIVGDFNCHNHPLIRERSAAYFNLENGTADGAKDGDGKQIVKSMIHDACRQPADGQSHGSWPLFDLSNDLVDDAMIDHIFASPAHFSMSWCGLVCDKRKNGRGLSDHRPVYADLLFKRCIGAGGSELRDAALAA